VIEEQERVCSNFKWVQNNGNDPNGVGSDCDILVEVSHWKKC
jgi:hypothetical protein